MIVLWLPILVFLLPYVFLTGLGSVLLIHHVEPFWGMYQQQTGVLVPNMSHHESLIFFSILILGPLFLVLGYFSGLKGIKKTEFKLNFYISNAPLIRNSLSLFFCILVIWGIYDLYKAGAFPLLYTWNQYDQWLLARYKLFGAISFFGFVNLYVLLPAVAAGLLLAYRNGIWKRIRFIPFLLVIFLDIFLYQKMPMILSILLMVGGLWVSSVIRNPAQINRQLSRAMISFFFILLTYILLVELPYLSVFNVKKDDTLLPNEELVYKTSNSSKVNKKDDPTTIRNKNSNQIKALKKIKASSSHATVTYQMNPVEYALLSLASRLAGPILYYPIVFPKLHDYFPFDLGMDILGLGSMPNENQVIWYAMYKNHKGSSAAPINFVFYSEGGMTVVFAGMFGVGIVLAIVWYFILNGLGGVGLRSLIGITVLLFSLHLSLDSLRNSTVASYGYGWVWILMIFAFLIMKMIALCFGSKPKLSAAPV